MSNKDDEKGEFTAVVDLEEAKAVAQKVLTFLESNKIDMIVAWCGLKLCVAEIEKACDIKSAETFSMPEIETPDKGEMN